MVNMILKSELKLVNWFLNRTIVADTETLRYAFDKQDQIKRRLAKRQGVAVNG